MKKFIRLILAALVSSLLIACSGSQTSVSSNEVSEASAIDPSEYITLGKYKGLSVTRMSSEVTAAEIEAEFKDNLDLLLKAVEITDRNDVKDGDIVNIDFVGKVDGKVLEGGTGKGYDLTIGSGTFIPGFEDGLVGIKTGEGTELNLKFPDNYPNDKDLEGKEVVFEVSVNSIKRMPEPTDENIKEATEGEYATVEEYKKSIKENLERTAADYADSAMYKDLWDQVVDNAELKKDIPQGLLNEKLSIMMDNAGSYAKMYGLDLDEYLSQVIGKTREEFTDEATEYAIKAGKESLVLMALAQAENIEVTQEDFDKAAKEYVELYNYGSVEEFLNSVNVDEFREYILKSKVQEFLADQADIKTE